MSLPGKRGVLTSYQLREGQVKGKSPPRKEKVVVSQYTQQQPTVFVSQPPHALTVEELNNTKYTHSVGYNADRPEMHFSYGQGTSSNFVPPPPERFMVNSNHTTGQPSQLPINSQSGHITTVHTVQQPLVQSIRRTFVPHHIYNEIPVMNSETKRYEVNEEDEEGLNQADQRMLEQYQKLYGNYMEEKSRSQHLERQLKEFELRINEREGSTVVDKPKRIDVRLLASLLMKKNQVVIDQVVQRRKVSCLNKIRSLMANQESVIKTTLLRSGEEMVRVKIR